MGVLRLCVRLGLAYLSLACLCISLLPAAAQAPVPVVMLSDPHFDPFHDPAKVQQLRAEPVARWPALLDAAPSPTQAADLTALQGACGSRALDSDWSLLKTTFAAAHDAEPHPLFVTLSGDLLAHGFPCRFYHLAPGATPQDLASFSAKTVTFVLAQLRQTFPRAPVYGALGNNDSGCTDYRATPSSSFVQNAGAALAVAAGVQPANVTPEGDYSVTLPAPMQHARLIVLENIFEARQFATCGGNNDRAAERAQLDWLRAQLAAARDAHEHVWFISHIPPGVDVYTSFHRYVLRPAEMCKAVPQQFLADTALADTLLDFADVIRLAVFGHTHMDEIRLLHRDSPDATIPVRLVPSVSPFLGNHPAFLVAQVDPRTAVLKDWRTFVSPGPEGSTPPWVEAYRYTTTYHLPDFSAQSALKLADSFVADRTGQVPASSAFRQHVYPGDFGLYALGLAQIWPAYACSVRDNRPSEVQKCVCAALPLPASDGTQLQAPESP